MKKLLAMILVLCMVLSLAACGSSNTEEKTPDTTQAETEKQPEVKKDDTTTQSSGLGETLKQAEEEEKVEEVKEVDVISELTGGALVDGKFPETVTLKVECYDRDGDTPAGDNMYTDYIKKQALERYNIAVEYVPVPRWTEVDQLNNLLAAQEAPDVCYTYDYATIQAYTDMDGVNDLSPYLTEEFKPLFANLWNWLGSAGLLAHRDPDTGAINAIEGKRAEFYRTATFIRQDWLDKLGLAKPTTQDEFEACLVAFRDNAETLLGADASKMVPLSLSTDAGWRASTLIESYLDPNITDKELYINGFDERHYTQNGTKDAIKVLNKWYNMDLIWKDFALYAEGDATEGDMQKAGYVGAMICNYDIPFRDGENSINYQLTQLVGPEAKFVAIDTFKDKNGGYTKYAYTTTGSDRKIFMPKTNTNVLAGFLFLNMITDPEIINYLQLGEEGITFSKNPDGSVNIIAADADHVANTINSQYNIDYTMTCNGLHLLDEDATIKSKALSYANVDTADVAEAMRVAANDAKFAPVVNVGVIEAESGLGNTLSDLRNSGYCKSIVASEADFDSVWDSCMNEYLAAGGQAIMDERAEAWQRVLGDKTMY